MNMRYLFLAIAVLFTMSAVAQETYENTKLIDNDLNGTARYVGMGGAMDALGSVLILRVSVFFVDQWLIFHLV